MPIDYLEPIDIQEVNDEIWFDIINRTITPKTQQISEDILVQSDANSRNLGFMIQRYFENEDLSTKRIRIHYVNSLNQCDKVSAHSIKVVGDNEEIVSFQWLVSDKVCVEGGNVQFAIEFYNDNEKYKLFTKPAIIGVTKGIVAFGEIPEPESDWFKEYSTRMNILETNMKNFNEAVDNGEFDGAYSLNTFANTVKGSKSGESIRMDDVSTVEHTMNVKVESKNLFDNIDDFNDDRATHTYEDGVLTVSGFYSSKNIYIDGGETYTFSFKSSRESDYGGGVYIASVSSTVETPLYNSSAGVSATATFTVPKDATRIYIVFYGGTTTSNTYATFTEMMLVKGGIATEYTPYLDPSTVTLTRCGKNLIPYPYADTTKENKGITFTDNKDGSITINGTATGEAYFNLQENVNYGETMMNAITAQNASNGVYVVNKRLFYNPINQKVSIVITQGTTVSNERVYPQLELGTVVTDWEQPKTQTAYTPNADGTVSGVTSLSPTTTLLTDTESAIIKCEYNKDTNLALKQVLPRSTNIALPTANWEGSISPYSQVVAINTVTSTSKIDLQPTPEQLAYFQNEEISLLTKNEDGVVTVYAIGEKPTTDLSIQAMITEVVSV